MSIKNLINIHHEETTVTVLGCRSTVFSKGGSGMRGVPCYSWHNLSIEVITQ
jgi:hypothetical protein